MPAIPHGNDQGYEPLPNVGPGRTIYARGYCPLLRALIGRRRRLEDEHMTIRDAARLHREAVARLKPRTTPIAAPEPPHPNWYGSKVWPPKRGRRKVLPIPDASWYAAFRLHVEPQGTSCLIQHRIQRQPYAATPYNRRWSNLWNPDPDLDAECAIAHIPPDIPITFPFEEGDHLRDEVERTRLTCDTERFPQPKPSEARRPRREWEDCDLVFGTPRIPLTGMIGRDDIHQIAALAILTAKRSPGLWVHSDTLAAGAIRRALADDKRQSRWNERWSQQRLDMIQADKRRARIIERAEHRRRTDMLKCAYKCASRNGPEFGLFLPIPGGPPRLTITQVQATRRRRRETISRDFAQMRSDLVGLLNGYVDFIEKWDLV